jgi:hypothetical protein
LPSHEKTTATGTHTTTKPKVETSTEAEMSNVPGLAHDLTKKTGATTNLPIKSGTTNVPTTGVHVPPSTHGLTSSSYPTTTGTTTVPATTGITTGSTTGTTTGLHSVPPVSTDPKHLMSDTMRDIRNVQQDFTNVGSSLQGIKEGMTTQPVTTSAGFSHLVNEAKHNLTTHSQDFAKMGQDIKQVGTDANLAKTQVQSGLVDIKEKFSGSKTTPTTGTTTTPTGVGHTSTSEPPSSH